jgi:hypothetical protein
MTVVAAYLYRHGKRIREVTIDEKIDCPSDKSEFVWRAVPYGRCERRLLAGSPVPRGAEQSG